MITEFGVKKMKEWNIKYYPLPNDYQSLKVECIIHDEYSENKMPATSYQFKVGDRVKVIDGFCGYSLKDFTGIVCEIRGDIGVHFDRSFSGGHSCNGTCPNGYGRYGSANELILIKHKRTLMQKLKTIARKVLDADLKLLIEAGLMDNTLAPTEEGMDESNTINYLANKAALVERAKEIIAEQKEEKNK